MVKTIDTWKRMRSFNILTREGLCSFSWNTWNKLTTKHTNSPYKTIHQPPIVSRRIRQDRFLKSSSLENCSKFLYLISCRTPSMLLTEAKSYKVACVLSSPLQRLNVTICLLVFLFGLWMHMLYVCIHRMLACTNLGRLHVHRCRIRRLPHAGYKPPQIPRIAEEDP